MKHISKIKHIITGTVITAVIVLTTFSSNLHAYFDGRVNVVNSPLNVRSCGSSSCQRVGRFLRDEIASFSGNYSSSRWLQIDNLDGNRYAYDFVYGRYISNRSSSLGSARSYSAKTTSALNVRTGPMVQYDRITTIPSGASVRVIEKNGNYLKVYWLPDTHQFTPVVTGYVHSNWVR